MLYTCIIFVLCVHLSLSPISKVCQTKSLSSDFFRTSFALLPLNHSNFRVSTKTKKTLEAQASLSWYYLAANDPHQCWIAENTACESFLKTSSALHTLSHAYIVWRYKCIHTMLCATMYVWDVYSLYNHFNSTMSQLQDVCKTCVSL